METQRISKQFSINLEEHDFLKLEKFIRFKYHHASDYVLQPFAYNIKLDVPPIKSKIKGNRFFALIKDLFPELSTEG
jgi:hypothetical protein